MKQLFSLFLFSVTILLFCSSCRDEKFVDYGKSSKYFYAENKTKILYDSTATVLAFLANAVDSYTEVPADVSTFEVIGDDFARDNKHLFYTYRILKNGDRESFYWDKSVSLPKDKDHVYLAETQTDYLAIIEDADPGTYKRVKLKYNCLKWYQDRNHYYYDHVRTIADRATLSFECPFFPYDKTHIFKIKDNKATSYRYKGTVRVVCDNIVHDDVRLFFCAGCYEEKMEFPIENPKTVRYYDRKNHIFRIDFRIYVKGILMIAKGLDAESFEVIDYPYSKDKSQVYYYDNVIEGADPETFEVLNHYYAKDKNKVYKSGKELKDYEPEKFVKDDWGRYPDDRDYGQRPSSGGGSFSFGDDD